MIDPDSILEEGLGGGNVDAFLEEILNISGGSLQDLGEDKVGEYNGGGVEMMEGGNVVEKVPENLEGEEGGMGLQEVEMEGGDNGGGEVDQFKDGGREEDNQVEMDGADDVESVAVNGNLEEGGKDGSLEGVAANEGIQTDENLESEQVGEGKDTSLEGEGLNSANDEEDFQTADEAERSDLSVEGGVGDKLEKKTETETEDKGVNRTAVNLFIPRLPIFGRNPQLAQDLSNVAKALETESSGKPSPESDADKQVDKSSEQIQMVIADKQVEPDSTTPPHIDDLNESVEDSQMSIGSVISEEMQETLDESGIRDDLETSKDQTEQESLNSAMDESASKIPEMDQASDNSEIDRTISDLVSSIVSTCAESEESINTQSNPDEANSSAENTEAPVIDQPVSNCDEPSFEEVMSILTSLDEKTSEKISENLSLNEKTDMSYDQEALDSSEIFDEESSSKVPENLEVPISQMESETEIVDEISDSPDKEASSKGGVISDDKSDLRDGKADEMEDDERSFGSLVIDEEEEDQVSSTSENITDQDKHPIPSAIPEKDAVIGDVSDSDLHKDSPDSAETQIVGEMDEHDLTDTNQSEVNHEQSTETTSEKEDHDGPFECEVCQRPFYRLDDALKCAKFSHNPDKLRSQLFPYACSQCPPDTLGFESVIALQKHWEDEHNHTFEKSSESQASDENKSEEAAEASKSKKDADSKKDKHLHICTICGQQLRSNYELNLHIKEEHGRKKKEAVYNFSCNKCPEKFKLRIELMRHYNQNHLKQSRVQRLRESRKAKMDERAGQVDEARAESNKKLAMNIQSAIKGVRQSRSHNSKTDQESKLGLKIYKCNLCPSGEGKAFRTFRALQTHKRFAHRNDPKWRASSPEKEKRLSAAEYRKITRNPGFVRVVDCTKEGKKKEAERKEKEKNSKTVVENLERLGKTTSAFQQQLNDLKESEEKKQLYRCETCGLFFRKMKKLIIHERSHEPSPAENEGKKRPSILEKINNVLGGKTSSSSLIGGPTFKSALTMPEPKPRGRPRKRDSAIHASSNDSWSPEKIELGRLRRIATPASSKPSTSRRSRSRKGDEDEPATSSSVVSAQPSTKEVVVRIRKVDDPSPKPVEEKEDSEETVIKYQCSACRQKFARKNSIYTHLSQNGKCRKRGGMPSLVSSMGEASDEDAEPEEEPRPSSLSKSRRNRPGPASYKRVMEAKKVKPISEDNKTGKKERPGPASKKNLRNEKVVEAKMDRPGPASKKRLVKEKAETEMEKPNKVLRKDRPGPASKKVEKAADISNKVVKDRPGSASKKVEKDAETSNKVLKARPGPASKKAALEKAENDNKEKKRKRDSDVATPEMTPTSRRSSLRQRSVEKVDKVKKDRPGPASKKAVLEKAEKEKDQKDRKKKKGKKESDSDFEVISFNLVTPEMPTRRSLRQISNASEVVVLEEVVKSDTKGEKRKEKKLLTNNKPGAASRKILDVSEEDSDEIFTKVKASKKGPESAKKKSNKDAKEAEPGSKIELSNIARKFSTRSAGSASKIESPKIVVGKLGKEGRSEQGTNISSKRNRPGPASWKGKDLQAKEAEAINEISNDAKTGRTRGRASLKAAEKELSSKVEKKAEGQATTPALKEVKIYLKRCDEPKRKRGREEVKSDKGKAKRRKMENESPAVLEKSQMYLFKRVGDDVVGFSKAISSKGVITITPKRKSSERQKRKSSSKMIEEEEAPKGPSQKSRKRVAEPERSEREEELKKRRTDRTSEKAVEKRKPSPIKNLEEIACKVCKKKFETKRELLKHLSITRCGEKRKTRKDSTESSPRTRGRQKKK